MADQNVQAGVDSQTSTSKTSQVTNQEILHKPQQTNLPESTNQMSQYSNIDNNANQAFSDNQTEIINVDTFMKQNQSNNVDQPPAYNHITGLSESNKQATETVIDNLNPQAQPSLQQAPQIQPLLSPDNDKQDINDPTATIINLPNQKQELPGSPQKSMVTKVKLSDELLFDWFKTTDIINSIAEKAKHSVDTIITALDPGMKEYLYSGGNINIMVISDTDSLISPIRDAFQTAFGRATVIAARYNKPEVSKAFPIKLACGFREASIVALERIKTLRSDASSVPQNQVIVAIQPAIVDAANIFTPSGDQVKTEGVDVSSSPKWFLTYCMVIEDPVLNAVMNSYSQFIPLEEDIYTAAKEADLPGGFQNSQLGFASSIEDLMNSKLKLAPRDLEDTEDCKWLHVWTGISETQIIRDLSSSLAHLYRRKWNEMECVN